MLSFAHDKENQVGHGQRIGAGGVKHRKTLGHTGFGSNDVNGKIGKGSVLPDSKSEPRTAHPGNLAVSVKKNATKASKTSSTAANPKQQRRTLGDISNRGNGSAPLGHGSSKKIGGKDGLPGSKLTVPMKSKSVKMGAHSRSSEIRTSSSKVAPVTVSERAKNRTTSTDEVADVEIALGRLGDEEDVLVQRLEERRFAAAMAESFKVSKVSMPSARGRHEIREPGPSVRTGYSRPTSSKSGSRLHHSTRHHGEGDDKPLMGGYNSGVSAAEKNLQKSIDRMSQDDLEEMGTGTGRGEVRSGSSARVHKELDMLEMNIGDLGEIGDLDSSPVSPLDDNFLNHDLELNFV